MSFTFVTNVYDEGSRLTIATNICDQASEIIDIVPIFCIECSQDTEYLFRYFYAEYRNAEMNNYT